jgi:hypothetical protein
MRRFAIFVAVFLVIVAIGSQPRRGEAADKSICVCIPSRAGLILKSAIVRTQARSTALLTSTASLIQ